MGAFLALVFLGLGVAAAAYKKERRGIAAVPVKQTQQVKPGIIAALLLGGLLLLILACN